MRASRSADPSSATRCGFSARSVGQRTPDGRQLLEQDPGNRFHTADLSGRATASSGTNRRRFASHGRHQRSTSSISSRTSPTIACAVRSALLKRAGGRSRVPLPSDRPVSRRLEGAADLEAAPRGGRSLSITHWPTFLNPGVEPTASRSWSSRTTSGTTRRRPMPTSAQRIAARRSRCRISPERMRSRSACRSKRRCLMSAPSMHRECELFVPPRRSDADHAVCDTVPSDRSHPRRHGHLLPGPWAIRRLTLNYGVRYDYFNGRVDASHVPRQSRAGFLRATLQRFLACRRGKTSIRALAHRMTYSATARPRSKCRSDGMSRRPAPRWQVRITRS